MSLENAVTRRATTSTTSLIYNAPGASFSASERTPGPIITSEIASEKTPIPYPFKALSSVAPLKRTSSGVVSPDKAPSKKSKTTLSQASKDDEEKKMAEDGKAMKSSGKAKGAAGDSYTLELPKSILSLDGAEAANFLSMLITPEDRKSLNKLSLKDDEEKKMAEVGKVMKSSGKAKGAADDSYTLELPKSVLSLDDTEAAKFISKMITPEDRQSLDKLSPEDTMMMMAGNLLKFTVMFAHLMESIKQDGKKMKELESTVLERTKEISSLTKKLAESEAKQRALSAKVAHLKEELTSTKSALEKSEKTSLNVRNYYKSREGKIRSSSKVEGVELMKNLLFQTELGQTFLQELHEGLNDAYRKSACCLGDMGEHFYHFYEYGFEMAVSQHSSSEFSGEYDRDGPILSITCPPSFEGDPNEPFDKPWWLPAMQQAVTNFVSKPLTLSELVPAAQPRYDLCSAISRCTRFTLPASCLPSHIR